MMELILITLGALVGSVVLGSAIGFGLLKAGVIGDSDESDTMSEIAAEEPEQTDTESLEEPDAPKVEEVLPPDKEDETATATKESDVASEAETRPLPVPVEDDQEHGDLEDEQEVYGSQVIDDVEEVQQAALAPRHVVEDDENYEYIRTEDKFIRSYFISGWPESMSDGQFQSLFGQSGNDIDISAHIDPIPDTEALDDLKDKVRDLEADFELLREDGQTVEAKDVQRKLADYQAMRDAIRDTDASLTDVSMYVSVAADDKSQLDRVSDEIETQLEENGLTPVLKTKDQERTFRSSTPILNDEIEKKRSMMGGSIGAMMPFASGTLIQETGLPIGEHADNRSPIIYDRFEHDRGYNWLTIGNIGAGKSFSTKLHLVRRRLYDPDTIIVMLDPLEGFAGVTKALDGQHVMVGGNFGINPLEIKRVPDEVLEENTQLDPGSAKLKDLKSFWESYFQLRGDKDGLGERWNTLERAHRIAYKRRDIHLDDPSTHGRENPTIRDDIVPVLLEMVTDVEEHTIINDIVDKSTNIDKKTVLDAASEVTDKEQKRAAELLLAMEPFLEGGALENIGRHSEFKMDDEDIVWLDLQQQEARGGLGLMMNLLFSAVYERAKQSDKRIIFAIDEARYIMRDKAALEFLEQAVRHSRHYDLSIQFITQTVDEFFQHPEAEAIADQCDHKLFFHTAGMDDDVREKVDMNPVQAQFVRNATPGDDERGYSEAAFGVADEGWFPVHIRANDIEAAVVDLDPSKSVSTALPGMADSEAVPEEIETLRKRLLEKYGEEVQVDLTPDSVVPEVRVQSEDGESETVVDTDAIQSSGPDLEQVLAEVVDDSSEDSGDESDGDSTVLEYEPAEK